ncbi:MAG TPA: hypothetical protein VH439_06355 [Gemmatimonadales bacterium]|jgi:hypothetical protein
MKSLAWLSLVLVAMIACKNTADSQHLATAVVSGRVTMDTGGSAPLAAMYAQATPTVACVRGTLSNWGRADSSGRYRLAVFGASVGSGDSGCVFVGALFPPTQSGKDTVLGPFRMKFADPPVDSATVDIVIHH